jgi:acetyl-CoA carboxylase biotin carboxyl carrier protein
MGGLDDETAVQTSFARPEHGTMTREENAWPTTANRWTCVRSSDSPRCGRVKLESVAAPVPTAAPVPAAAAPPPAAEKPARQLHEIKSPTPGTFYAQEKPGTPPFVSVGSRVTPTTVVCVIEAMKIFNDITADCTGVVVEVLAGDKQAVEYGTVLFRVDPSA